MNTADVRGDIYFNLISRYLPVECSEKNMSSPTQFDCANSEINAGNLSITKLVLEVDAGYGKSNVQKPHTGPPTCVLPIYCAPVSEATTQTAPAS